MKLRCLLYAFCLLLACSTVQAEPTDIKVYVKAKGSKFIGSSMGGARVVLTDAMTGRILDEGKTAGGTGDTKRSMKTPLRSTQPLSSQDAAHYTATIDLEEPTLIRIEAYGPLAQPQSAHSAGATQWIIPGKDITAGDAFLLVLPGMVVDILAPASSSRFESGTPIDVEANISMGCGCPLEPGGLWDSAAMDIKGLVSKDGQRVADIDLPYAGTPSRFQGRLEVNEPGVYEVLVYVYDSENGNTGLDRTVFRVVGQ
ncbi:MAG: hypothetical protein K9K64_03120 [Desulfohalobiaceae bacterium]|nr:hypothetical protein [Desulfohalobiaceae bacterium]